MKVVKREPVYVQALRLRDRYDQETHQFCEQNFVSVSHNPDGTITVQQITGGGDNRRMSAMPGDVVVIDHGVQVMDFRVFEMRYQIPQDIAA